MYVDTDEPLLKHAFTTDDDDDDYDDDDYDDDDYDSDNDVTYMYASANDDDNYKHTCMQCS